MRRFDLRLRQLVKQYFDNVPKNDVAPSRGLERRSTTAKPTGRTTTTGRRWESSRWITCPSSESAKSSLSFLSSRRYMLGLSWIMQYYCKGCVSWDWFYPQHYAPLLRDLSAMNNVTVSFVKGKPISKLEAMIAVLSLSSLHLDTNALRVHSSSAAGAARCGARLEARSLLSSQRSLRGTRRA